MSNLVYSETSRHKKRQQKLSLIFKSLLSDKKEAKLMASQKNRNFVLQNKIYDEQK